jgi:hypothetical protein
MSLGNMVCCMSEIRCCATCLADAVMLIDNSKGADTREHVPLLLWLLDMVTY